MPKLPAPNIKCLSFAITLAPQLSAILKRLSQNDLTRLEKSYNTAEKLERSWDLKITKVIQTETERVIHSLEKVHRIPHDLSFEKVMCNHYFACLFAGFKIAMTDDELEENPSLTRLAQKKKIPTSLKDLMKQYDAYRKGEYTPKGPKSQAEQLKKAYLKKLNQVWETHSEDFRNGKTATQDEVISEIKRAAKTTTYRATMIVRTETTSYYNQSKKKYYDSSQDVTHYIFLAIRDKATSPWCSPKKDKKTGKIGRHGLVYKKDDPLLDRETPAIHPNCRSEILPLTMDNPVHKKLIQDKSIQRRNNQCYPLLSGWGKR